jgi:N,N'-diacetyllegionaminate synthase
MDKIYIIAEAGVNHNGDIKLAKRMIEEAKKAGADAVKFQTFRSEKLVSAFAPKAGYQMQTTDCHESQLDMLKKLELSYSDFTSLCRYAKETGIDFLSTPFENDSIEFLDTLNMRYWKIPSGEITNKPYLIRISKTRRPIILSTGMSTMKEISDALDIFADYNRKDIILLHCNTEYPTPYCDVNLRAMKTLGETFGVRFGYSDHTQGIEIPIAAAALGASVIEKHFTLDHTMQGPDHKASLEPNQLSDMIKAIRNVEQALGSFEKAPSASELKNIHTIRKSIVAKCSIKRGEIFTEDNITTKRPGMGISPMKWFEVLGGTAKRDFHEDENIEL